MIFISYYTENTPYEEVMNTHLLPSLKKWDLRYDIISTRDKGSWQFNTGYKSTFIKEMLLKHKEDVCFIDADGTIEKYPDLLFNIPEEYDIAIHQLDWFLFWRGELDNPHRELLSGTMVIKYKDSALLLIDEWIKQVGIQASIKEQKVLDSMVASNKNYKVYDLPPSYCAILKRDGGLPKYIGEPVVLHHQVSRQLKQRKNWKV
ncbi:hypothetical protein LCGC14_2450270 [marine sediment metagenome]|uniref:Nucleotide-diphospho-sugar transferase domain-containing protein n=1 Tax=marine sediment metagenome TaxID=412755 RepID=A0A0F9EA75_9ZZZZ